MLASIVARRVCRPAGARALTLYSTPGIPSPDIVRMYLEEVGKSDSVEQVKINVNKGENRAPEFLEINPMGEVPALKLDDGTVISDSTAIVQYLDEAVVGGSSVFGTSAQERAETMMLLERVNTKYFNYMVLAFQNGPMADWFSDGRREGWINKDLSPPCAEVAAVGQKWVDDLLSDGRPFLGGDRFCHADIKLYIYQQFVSKMDKRAVISGEDTPHLAAYMQRVAERPSAVAIQPPRKKKT